jgi:hypothetical protein
MPEHSAYLDMNIEDKRCLAYSVLTDKAEAERVEN